MRNTFTRRLVWYAVLTLAVVPVGDSAHVGSGTTQYFVDWGPRLGEAPLWFLAAVLFGLMVAAALRTRVIRRFPPPATPRPQLADAVGAACAVLMIYLATSLLRNANLVWSTPFLWAAALLMWSRLDRTRAGFVMGLLVAPAAAIEILCVKLGLIGYAADINVLFGVAPWLPALYFAIGVAVSVVEGYADSMEAERHEPR